MNDICIAKRTGAWLGIGTGLTIGGVLNLILWQGYQLVGRAGHCQGALEMQQLFGLHDVIPECLPDPVGWGTLYGEIVALVLLVVAWAVVWKHVLKQRVKAVE